MCVCHCVCMCVWDDCGNCVESYSCRNLQVAETWRQGNLVKSDGWWILHVCQMFSARWIPQSRWPCTTWSCGFAVYMFRMCCWYVSHCRSNAYAVWLGLVTSRTTRYLPSLKTMLVPTNEVRYILDRKSSLQSLGGILPPADIALFHTQHPGCQRFQSYRIHVERPCTDTPVNITCWVSCLVAGDLLLCAWRPPWSSHKQWREPETVLVPSHPTNCVLRTHVV